MLDINFIRENAGKIKEAVAGKKIDLNVDVLLEVDQQRRGLIGKVEDLRRQRNEVAKERNIEKGKAIKAELDHMEEDLAKVELQFDELMVKVPTIPAPDTPPGKSDEENVEVYKWGEVSKFDFTPKDHIQLAQDLDIIDFDAGAKVAGYRGYYVKNEGVMLMMAIMMHALTKLIEKGFTPMIPPTLIKGFALFGSGYFKGVNYNPEVDEIYQVASSDKEMSGEEVKDQRFLIGTAEPALLAYYSGDVLEEKSLPLKLAGFSQCYRSEIGSYGKDTKGLYRVHEFMKVEQVVICPADIELADKLQQEMTQIALELHQELGIPHRMIRICLGDLTAGKYKQFDTEAWLPGSNRWAETGSASNFVDWQSRRLNVKYTDKNGEKKYVYMLNSTAFPTPRPFIAILENFQQEDGSIIIPEVLRKYTGFSEIKPK